MMALLFIGAACASIGWLVRKNNHPCILAALIGALIALGLASLLLVEIFI